MVRIALKFILRPHNVKFRAYLTVNIQQPFDAVLLDYRMPKINGIEVAKEILAVNPHQRIIFAKAIKETMTDPIKRA